MIATIGKFINRFLFAEEETSALAIFRIAFGLYLLLLLVASAPNWTRFYGVDGLFPLESARGVDGHLSYSLLNFFDSPQSVQSYFWLMLMAALSFTLGLFNKISAAIVYLLYLSLTHRNSMLVNGQDQVALALLFPCIFAPLDRRFSLRAWLARSRKIELPSRAPVWTWRLLQLTLCNIYLFSGPTKCLDHHSWCDGSALYYVALSERWFRFPEVALFLSPAFYVPATFIGLAAELFFPYLVWWRRIRILVVLAMIVFHLLIIVFLSPAVAFFNLLMMVGLLLFFGPSSDLPGVQCQ